MSIPQQSSTNWPRALDGHAVDGHAVDGHAMDSPSRPSTGFDSAEQEVVHLRRLMVSLPVIEQAKGIVMGYFGVTEDTAFAILRRWSSVRNTKVRVLSADLVSAAGGPAATPFAGLADYLRVNELA